MAIDLQKIANDLLAAHASKKPIDEKPELENHAQAYQIQKMIAEKLGPRAGWKIGNSPSGKYVRAPMFKRTTFIGDAQIKRDFFNRCLVESELAIVFKDSMPKRKNPYTIEEINSNIASINVGIEICDSRLIHWPDCNTTWQLADSLTHGGYVLGSGIQATQHKLSVDLHKKATFKINIGTKNQPPRISIQDTRGHPFKDPTPIALWLVNELILQNDQINAGDIITTGSFSGSTPINSGEIATVEIDGFGKAVLIVN
jgi:2-keto-4-pentenoate hydratase